MFGKIKQTVEEKVKVVATKTAVSTIKEYMPVIKLVLISMIFLGASQSPEPVVNVFIGGYKHD